VRFVWLEKGVRWADVVVHGAAKGWDDAANHEAQRQLREVHPFPCDWSGGETGPHRNQRMVDWMVKTRENCVDPSTKFMCLGFPSLKSRGTCDCLRRAAKAGLTCYYVDARTNKLKRWR
jgi:hypothetical protein